VAIIGNGGGGKTTAALRLAAAWDLPLLEIDKIQFRPGWVRTPSEEVAREHDLWIERDRWIIDGFGPWPQDILKLQRTGEEVGS
jgi:adenylate kinase family enzyme